MEEQFTITLSRRQSELLRDLLRQTPNIPDNGTRSSQWSRQEMLHLTDDALRQFSEQGL